MTTTNSPLTVAVLGASANPERYSYKALRLLREYGHNVIPINPGLKSVDGLAVIPNLGSLLENPASERPHTVTIYVSPKHIGPLIEDLIELHPTRVIVNPGAESKELEDKLADAGIPYVEACTIVMLRTNQF